MGGWLPPGNRKEQDRSRARAGHAAGDRRQGGLDLTTGTRPRRILFVALKKEAQPVLSELRSMGHGVSLVEDMDEAGVLLSSGGFEHVVLPAGSLASMLKQRALWGDSDAESWRQTVTGLARDLEHLLQSLRRGLDSREDYHDPLETGRTIS